VLARCFNSASLVLAVVAGQQESVPLALIISGSNQMRGNLAIGSGAVQGGVNR
jgi:hypothetical protein